MSPDLDRFSNEERRRAEALVLAKALWPAIGWTEAIWVARWIRTGRVNPP